MCLVRIREIGHRDRVVNFDGKFNILQTEDKRNRGKLIDYV